MTKQEEIIRGIIEITKSRPMTYQILRWLRDEGVVTKVERELPDNEAWHKNERDFEAYCAGRNILIGAGYVPTAPFGRR